MIPSQKINVFVLDDMDAFTDGLKLYFQQSECIRFVGSANTAEECIDLIKEKSRQSIDIIILDIVLGQDRLGGIKVAKEIKEIFRFKEHAPHIVFLTGHESQELRSIAQSLNCSFLDKSLRIPAIIEKIKQIHANGKGILKAVKPTLSDQLQKELSVSLTPSEGRIAVNLAMLGTNEAVAKELLKLEKKIDSTENIKRKTQTVNTHLRNAYAKLDFCGLIDLINTVKGRQFNKNADARTKLIIIIRESQLMDHIRELNKEPGRWFGRSCQWAF